jgi:hypothetical protein
MGSIVISLKTWPSGSSEVRYWVPMMDIFHYSRPQSVEHWNAKHLWICRMGV